MKVRRKERIVIPPLEADTYPGTLVGIADLGEQEFMKKMRRELALIFEIDGENVEIEGELQPRLVSRIFTASIDKKSNLYGVLTGWLGGDIEDDEFDLSPLLGVPGLLNVVVKTNKDGIGYNFIQGVMKPMRGMKIDAPKSELLEFSMEDPKTWDNLDKFPEWIGSIVEKSPTWAALQQNSGEQITPKDFEPEKRQAGF